MLGQAVDAVDHARRAPTSGGSARRARAATRSGVDAEVLRELAAGTRSRRCTGRCARWPASISACVTIPIGFVKSTIQAPGAPRSAVSSASSSTTGTVRSAFANPAGAGRLLADAAEARRDRLVPVARRLPPDAELDDHEIGAVDRRDRGPA